jgi:hypothetical protein
VLLRADCNYLARSIANLGKFPGKLVEASSINTASLKGRPDVFTGKMIVTTLFTVVQKYPGGFPPGALVLGCRFGWEN